MITLIDRESTRRPVDDTPMMTPTHRYNSWATNRKRSGVTPQISGMSYPLFYFIEYA